jgi:DNA-binding LacI/PurR family transcriptional regulator
MKIKSVAIAAMDLLDYAMSGVDKTPRHITITPELVLRKSCRPI